MFRKVTYKLCILLLMPVLLLISCSTYSQAIVEYPACFKWNDNIYLKEGPEVNQPQVGEELGKITKLVAKMPNENGESNFANEDSKIFKLKNNENLDRLIIQVEGNYYYSSKKE